MIFSNKIYKIASGKNVSFYPISEQKCEMFVFNKVTAKKMIELFGVNFARCTDLKQKYNYHKLIKINETHSAVCFDKKEYSQI